MIEPGAANPYLMSKGMSSDPHNQPSPIYLAIRSSMSFRSSDRHQVPRRGIFTRNHLEILKKENTWCIFMCLLSCLSKYDIYCIVSGNNSLLECTMKTFLNI